MVWIDSSTPERLRINRETAEVVKQLKESGAIKEVEETKKEEAQRISHPIRYDILDPEFLDILARIADYGAKRYGDFNWHKSRLTGDKSPINHIYKHLKSYRMYESYDHEELGTHRKYHLAAIAFNAMMEFYYENSQDKISQFKQAIQQGKK